MKVILTALVLALGLPLAAPAVLAGMDHAGHAAGDSHAAMNGALSEGVVRKVDPAQGKLTIRHGPLANLAMPAMTMIFRVQNPAVLERVKPGDNIRFKAEQVNGLLTVTRLEVVQ